MDVREILDRAGGPAIATDENDRILAWNRPAEALLGVPASRGGGEESFGDLFAARDIFGNRFAAGPAVFLQMLARGEMPQSFEVDLRKGSGAYARVAVSVVVVLGAAASGCRLVYLLNPVMQRRKADEAIERILANPRLASSLARAGGGVSAERPELTERQIEVLRLLTEGKTVWQIAAALGITVSTVRSHIRNLLETLGVHSQVEAVARAFRERLI